MKHLISRGIIACAAIGFASPASATLIGYSGQDNVATTSSPHPNSAAAAAAFDAAVAGLGGGSLIDFESAPLGSFSNLTIAPGVTINGTNIFSANHTIRNTSGFPSFPTLDGYNTTSGGANLSKCLVAR